MYQAKYTVQPVAGRQCKYLSRRLQLRIKLLVKGGRGSRVAAPILFTSATRPWGLQGRPAAPADNPATTATVSNTPRLTVAVAFAFAFALRCLALPLVVILRRRRRTLSDTCLFSRKADSSHCSAAG
jgi:hypothetical protein